MKSTLRKSGLLAALTLLVTLAALCGCATKVYPKAAGDTSNDLKVSAAIAKALGDDGLYNYSDVSVVTTNGITQLNGFVTSWQAIDHAEDIARTTRGIQQVHNNLVEKR